MLCNFPLQCRGRSTDAVWYALFSAISGASLAHRIHRHAATKGQGCASLWTPNGAIHAFLAGAGPRAEGLDLGVSLTGRFSPFGGITGLSPVAVSMIDLASWLGFGMVSHSGFLSGRSVSSYVGTWVLSHHDSSAAPQTVQTASPVCGTKNFSSVRLYSAPQLH